MAKTIFFLRSKEGESSTIYFRYRNGRYFDLTLKTPFSVPSQQWDEANQRQINPYDKLTPKTVEKKREKAQIDIFNNNLSLFINEFQNFITISPNSGKDDIKKYIQEKYFPAKIATTTKRQPKITDNLFTDCIDLYIKDKSRRIEGKQEPISAPTNTKLNTIRNTIAKFNKNITLKQIDDDFRDNYTIYMQSLGYSPNTIVKDLKYIKSICKHHSKKMKVHTDVLTWGFIAPKQKYSYPVLTSAEIEIIRNLELPHEYLENARDWLLIGIHTSARVSDLLNFDSKNIIEGNLLNFSQTKTKNQVANAEITIYLNKEVMRILEKRSGNFPRKISDQKFNDYIKDVAKLAGLNQKMIGGKIDPKTKKKVIGEYEKWELVSSHIMRRSYVTLNISTLGKELVKVQTGHRTDKMVEHYDKTENIEKAKRLRSRMQELGL